MRVPHSVSKSRSGNMAQLEQRNSAFFENANHDFQIFKASLGAIMGKQFLGSERLIKQLIIWLSVVEDKTTTIHSQFDNAEHGLRNLHILSMKHNKAFTAAVNICKTFLGAANFGSLDEVNKTCDTITTSLRSAMKPDGPHAKEVMFYFYCYS